MEYLLQLLVLFFVIVDPPASCIVFISATKDMDYGQKIRIAILAICVAVSVSMLVLLLGNYLLVLLNTSISDIRVAGGIVLGLLGVKMAMGNSLSDTYKIKSESGRAIASIIGTPLLTGPAAITTIIVSSNDFGIAVTGVAIIIIMAVTGAMLYLSAKMTRFMNESVTQVLSTILGLITLAWGVMFIRTGLGI